MRIVLVYIWQIHFNYLLTSKSGTIPPLQHSPVHDLPELGEVGGTAVLVVEVVGVLPDVEGEDGTEAAGDGVAGAGLLGDDEGAVGDGPEPDPAGAEEPGALGDEVVLEGVEAAPLLDDLLQEGGIFRRLRAAGAELRKIQVVVQDLSCVVEDGAVGLADDLFERHAFEGRARQKFVQVIDIALEVLAVVEADGAGADDRLERILRIRKFNQCKHIVVSLFVLRFLFHTLHGVLDLTNDEVQFKR